MGSVYETVTQQIIAELEKGIAPWVKPWQGGGIADLPYNAVSQRRYSGVNVLLLWGATLTRGYRHASWLTFNQTKALGGYVRKGEHAVQVVFASTYTKKAAAADTGEEEKERIPFLKFYAVFNIDQVAGLPEHLYYLPEPKPISEALAGAEVFIAALGADVRHGGNRAGYAPTLDCILLPHRERFASVATYCATSLHEHGHWSGHGSRLNRDLSGRFGDQSYAAEELVAEMTAAFLCAHLAIPGELRHPEYIGSWLKVLGGDKRAIFTAAAKATEAANYLRSLAEPADDSVVRHHTGIAV